MTAREQVAAGVAPVRLAALDQGLNTYGKSAATSARNAKTPSRPNSQASLSRSSSKAPIATDGLDQVGVVEAVGVAARVEPARQLRGRLRVREAVRVEAVRVVARLQGLHEASMCG